MDLEEIKKLIDIMDEKALTEIEVEDSERRIRLKREPAHTPGAVSSPVPDVKQTLESGSENVEVNGKKTKEITSPIVGTFYKAPSPDANPYIGLGDVVKKGQTLCVVEAMKLMNEIESDLDGRIVEICVDDGAAVEFGEALFMIDPS